MAVPWKDNLEASKVHMNGQIITMNDEFVPEDLPLGILGVGGGVERFSKNAEPLPGRVRLEIV